MDNSHQPRRSNVPIGPDHPALAARIKLSNALDLIDSDLSRAVDLFDVVELEARGSFPFQNLQTFRPQLEKLADAAPNNLTVKLNLAEARHRSGDEAGARPLFIETIRDIRPTDSKKTTATIDAADFRARCAGHQIWHSVDLGNSFVEGARKTSRVLATEMMMMELPDLTDLSVLDIGSFGGWFAFEAERYGASRVVANDYYSWVIKFAELQTFIREQRAKGLSYSQYDPPEHCKDLINLPGMTAFLTARDAISSKIEPKVGIFEEVASGFEPFDVVFYLGVLYHCKDPFRALATVAECTKRLAIIETLGYCVPGRPDFYEWRFYGREKINQDYTTWWAPTEEGLIDMLIAAGFSRVEIKYGWNCNFPFRTDSPQAIRIWAHAYKD